MTGNKQPSSGFADFYKEHQVDGLVWYTGSWNGYIVDSNMHTQWYEHYLKNSKWTEHKIYTEDDDEGWDHEQSYDDPEIGEPIAKNDKPIEINNEPPAPATQIDLDTQLEEPKLQDSTPDVGSGKKESPAMKIRKKDRVGNDAQTFHSWRQNASHKKTASDEVTPIVSKARSQSAA